LETTTEMLNMIYLYFKEEEIIWTLNELFCEFIMKE
jgi:hypothetical protein